MHDGISRRRFVKVVGALGAGLSLGWQRWAAAAPEAQAAHDAYMKGAVDFMGFRAKEITPNADFYITTYSSTVPAVAPDGFQLTIDGRVRKPLSLSLADLDAQQNHREYVTLECIGNGIGGSAISNALWEGVSLRTLLEQAGPLPGNLKAVFHAADGYTDSIPFDLAMAEEVFLAWRMNGEPLPREHGYPLRAIVPGIYGMKNVKWLSHIELVDYDFKGYWEKRGWSDVAEIPLKSKILLPMAGNTLARERQLIGGVAFGGRHKVKAVQVSVDGGEHWNDAQIKPPLSAWAWTLWVYHWTPPGSGDYTLQVRAIDGRGKVQQPASLFGRIFSPSFPDGAHGIHQVKVSVS